MSRLTKKEIEAAKSADWFSKRTWGSVAGNKQ